MLVNHMYMHTLCLRVCEIHMCISSHFVSRHFFTQVGVLRHSWSTRMPGKRLAGPRVSVKELAQSLHGAVPDFQGPTLIECTPQGQEGVTQTTFENPQTFKVCHAVVSRWGGRAIKKTTCISAIDLATSETYWNINLGPHFGEHEGGKLHICLMYLWNSYVRAHHSRHAKLNELKAILATAHPQAQQRYAKLKQVHRARNFLWKRGHSYCIDAVVCPQPIPDYPPSTRISSHWTWSRRRRL